MLIYRISFYRCVTYTHSSRFEQLCKKVKLLGSKKKYIRVQRKIPVLSKASFFFSLAVNLRILLKRKQKLPINYRPNNIYKYKLVKNLNW